MLDWAFVESLVTALGWALVHFLWQGMGIAAVFWLVCRLAADRNAVVRYWAGMIGFAVAFLLPVVTFFLYYNPPSSGFGAAYQFSGAGAATVYALNPSVTQLISAGIEPALPLVVALWALGVSFLSFRAFVGWIGAWKLVNVHTHPVSQRVVTMVRRLECHLGVSRMVRVFQSTQVDVPTVMGWLKPVILLPVSVLTRLPEEQLEMVLAHELGHVRRFDYVFNMIQVVIETLFFYHPAIRWMSRQVRQEREHCCDDLVVRSCNKPVVYARALANIESLRGPDNTLALAATGGDLVHRVRRIVKRDLPRNSGGFAQLAMMLSVASVVALSAHQGVQIRNQAVESSVSDVAVSYQVPAGDELDRGAWTTGVSVYSGLGRIRQALENRRTQVVKREEERRLAAYRAEQQRLARLEAERLETEALAQKAKLELPDLLPAHDMFAQEVASEVAAPNAETPAEIEMTEEQLTYQVRAGSVVAPVYPFKARRKRVEGHVRLEFSINGRGEPTNIQVVEASPPEVFDSAAVRALEKWGFQVADDHSETTRILQVFDFSMEEAAPVLPKRERRCDITGSRICGLKSY